MFLHLPLVFTADDHDRISDALLTGSGPVVGFRVEAASLLVSVDVGAWLLAVGGQPTVEAVTRYVEAQLA